MSKSLVRLEEDKNHWIGKELEKLGIHYPHYVSKEFALMCQSEFQSFLENNNNSSLRIYIESLLKSFSENFPENDKLSYADVYIYFWLDELFDKKTWQLKDDLNSDFINNVHIKTFKQMLGENGFAELKE